MTLSRESQTIAAIATPPGEGGIAVIRISGEHALDIAQKLFSKNVLSLPSRMITFGKILDSNRTVIDDVLLFTMRAPHSFTGENVVEIHCHGGVFITQQVLSRVFQCGASPAEPGEFSQRAFLNGKIDLAQAEAIQQLIHAKSDLALSAAKTQLNGHLSKTISQWQNKLTHIAAIIEAWVDYPEEGLEFASHETILSQLSSIHGEIEALKDSFYDGRTLNQGIDLCILGAPNVGKSSLMNALIGFDRAIVTDIAGTTRDILEAEIKWGGLHFNLIDTAGIRTTDEIIEQEGIRRSLEASQKADLILVVLDASRSLEEHELKLISALPKQKTLLVWNKIDLPHLAIPQIEDLFSVEISVKNLMGLSHLKETILSLIYQEKRFSKEEVMITQERHYQALFEALNYLKQVINGLQTNVSAEFISFDLRATLKALGRIVGTDVTEDILNAIFSNFCVGK